MYPVCRSIVSCILPLIVLITTAATATPMQEDSRFERIVTQITDSTLRNEAVQEIGFSFSHNRFSGTIPESLRDSFIIAFTPQIEWHSQSLRATNARLKKRSFGVRLNGSVQQHGILQTEDAVTITTASNFTFQNAAIDLHFNQELSQRLQTRIPLHIGTTHSLFGNGFWFAKKGFEPDMDDARSIIKVKYIDETRQEGRLGGALSFSLSLGSTRDLSPVLRALELEKRFLSIGGCAFPLSDKTLGALAEHCATGRNSNLRHDTSLAAFKKVIDSLMLTDAAVKKTDLRYVPPLDIRRALMRQLPELSQGLSAALRAHAKGALVVQRSVRDWRNDPEETLPDLHCIKPAPAFDIDLSLEGKAARALTPGVWVRLASQGALLETQTYLHDTLFTQGKRQIHPWNFTGEGSILLMPSPLLQCEIGVGGIPLFIAIPEDLPQWYGLSIWLGFEDRLGACARVSWSAPQKVPSPILDEQRSPGLFISLSLSRIF